MLLELMFTVCAPVFVALTELLLLSAYDLLTIGCCQPLLVVSHGLLTDIHCVVNVILFMIVLHCFLYIACLCCCFLFCFECWLDYCLIWLDCLLLTSDCVLLLVDCSLLIAINCAHVLHFSTADCAHNCVLVLIAA